MALMQGKIDQKMTTITQGLAMIFMRAQGRAVAQVRHGQDDAPPRPHGRQAVHLDTAARAGMGAVQATLACALASALRNFVADITAKFLPIGRIGGFRTFHE